MKLKVGDKEFSVKVADTPETRSSGLKTVKKGSMPKDAGLVLKYDTPEKIDITMIGMKFPIDIIFIKAGKVQKIKAGDVGQDNINIDDVSDLILEVPRGASEGLKAGDTVDWGGEKLEDGTIQKADGGVMTSEDNMQVLDENGKVQTNIQGDERIFSRKHTEKLCSLAEIASKSKSDSDYKKLGTAMMRMIDKQDTQDQEYVTE